MTWIISLLLRRRLQADISGPDPTASRVANHKSNAAGLCRHIRRHGEQHRQTERTIELLFGAFVDEHFFLYGSVVKDISIFGNLGPDRCDFRVAAPIWHEVPRQPVPIDAKRHLG